MSRNIRIFRWPVFYANQEFKKESSKYFDKIYVLLWRREKKTIPSESNPMIESDQKGSHFLNDAISIREVEMIIDKSKKR